MCEEEYTGVVDRIIDDDAVVLLENDDGDVVGQRELPVERLPEDGRHEGALFDVCVQDGAIVGLSYRPETEAERRKRLAETLDRLSEPLDNDE